VRDLKVFFLGGLTAKTSILLTQALPAAVARVLVLLASRR
jgi:uncharacterized membrane protein